MTKEEEVLIKIKNKLLINFVVFIVILCFNYLFKNQSTIWIFNNFKFTIFILVNIAILLLFMCFFNKLKVNNINRYYKFIDFYTFIVSSIGIICFILLNIFNPSLVVGESMEDTLQDGDRVLIWKLLYEVDNDDIVVINISKDKYGSKEDSLYIKRVVAVSNDEVRYSDGMFYINDLYVCDLTYDMFLTLTNCNFNDDGNVLNSDTFIIPEGYSVVFGDNYSNSLDSRYIGLIDNDDIIGTAIFRFFPFNKIEILK